MVSFGTIKNTFNDLLIEGMAEKDSNKKSIFQKYIKLIKENEILRNQFYVYSNIENKVEKDVFNASVYLNENLKLLDKYKPSDIITENEKLKKLIDNKESGDYPNLELHNHISNLIVNNRNGKNIDSITESVNYVIKHIVKNEPKIVSEAIDLPNSMIISIMVDTYNKKYGNLNESDKKIVKTLIDSDEKTKGEVYESTIKECLSMINEQLNTNDLVVKEKLLAVKEKLLNINVSENFISDMSKLIELKEGLK